MALVLHIKCYAKTIQPQKKVLILFHVKHAALLLQIQGQIAKTYQDTTYQTNTYHTLIILKEYLTGCIKKLG